MLFKAKYRLLHPDASPLCPHGPTLLFENISNKKQFFTCAAYRDRKGCPFYLLREDFERGRGRSCNKTAAVQTGDNKRLIQILRLPPQQRSFCSDCNILLLETEKDSHKNHAVRYGLSDQTLIWPVSQLLSCRSNDKREAQYWFSDKSKQFILKQLQDRGLNRVICVGTPTIHEAIQTSSDQSDSILLDIDCRIAQFYPRSKFVAFNIGNQYFAEGTRGRNRLLRFIGKSDVKELAIVMDPPFGCFVQLISQTLKFLQEMIEKTHRCSTRVPVIVCLPSFLRTFTESIPDMRMSAYRVIYRDHRNFKKNSPVRIFTNIPLREFVLPASEGYKLCNPCGMYEDAEVNHCSICNSCLFKPGYHCKACGKCYSLSFKHCSICRECKNVTHKH